MPEEPDTFPDLVDVIDLNDVPESHLEIVGDLLFNKYPEVVAKSEWDLGDISRTLGYASINLKEGERLPAFKRLYYLSDLDAQHLNDLMTFLERFKVDFNYACRNLVVKINHNSGKR